MQDIRDKVQQAGAKKLYEVFAKKLGNYNKASMKTLGSYNRQYKSLGFYNGLRG